ncbi:YbjQ family protein [Dokdonella sp.]|uniref:YbjQ family protein n=1 Tax=Dokdonella sp. TaxID=2291710 RepID=UPI003C700F7C
MTDDGNSLGASKTTALTNAMITTALELPGYRIVKSLGVVRGLTVRSRSIVGNFIGGLHALFGGNITVYTTLCEQTRAETYQLMIRQARMLGANAIVGMRYDATELMPGMAEVLCYGTAVVVDAVE